MDSMFVWSLHEARMEFEWICIEFVWKSYGFVWISLSSKCICYSLKHHYQILPWCFNYARVWFAMLFIIHLWFFISYKVFCCSVDILNTRLFWYIVMRSPRHSMSYSFSLFAEIFIVPKLSDLFIFTRLWAIPLFHNSLSYFILRNALSYFIIHYFLSYSLFDTLWVIHSFVFNQMLN